MAKADWLNLNPTKGTGNAKISNAAGRFTGRVNRSTTVTGKADGVASPRTYTLVQKGVGEFIDITETVFTVSQDGGTLTVRGRSNSPKLTFAEQSDGIGISVPATYTAAGKSTSNGANIAGDPGATAEYEFSVAFSIPQNMGETTRSAVIRVTGLSASIVDSFTIQQQASDWTYTLTLAASESMIPASGGSSTITATLKKYLNGTLQDTETVPVTLKSSNTTFTVSGSTVSASTRGTAVGAVRSTTVTGSYVTEETGETVTASVTVQQEENEELEITYGTLIVNTFSYDVIPASGGTETPTLSYTQSRVQNYTSKATKNLTSLTSGGTARYSGTSVNTTTGAVTAGSRGTTVDTTDRTITTASVVVTMNGKSSGAKTATVKQQANREEEIKYGSWSVSVIGNRYTTSSSPCPASGGTVTLTRSASRTRTQVYTSGSTELLSPETATPTLKVSGTGASLSGTTVTWANRGTVVGSARNCTVTASHAGVTANEILYQQANSQSVDRITGGITTYDDVIAGEIVTDTISASGGTGTTTVGKGTQDWSRTAKITYYSYTSGATDSEETGRAGSGTNDVSPNYSTVTYTATSKGTTLSSENIVKSQQITWTGSGGKSATATAYVYQEANEREVESVTGGVTTYSEITLSPATIDTILVGAEGGNWSVPVPTAEQTYSTTAEQTTYLYTSGSRKTEETAPADSGDATVSQPTAVSGTASSKGATLSGVTTIKEGSYSFSANGKTASVSYLVQQEANEITGEYLVSRDGVISLDRGAVGGTNPTSINAPADYVAGYCGYGIGLRFTSGSSYQPASYSEVKTKYPDWLADVEANVDSVFAFAGDGVVCADEGAADMVTPSPVNGKLAVYRDCCVNENTGSTLRTGYFQWKWSHISTFTTPRVNVIQAAGAYLNVSPTSLSFPAAGGTQTITIDTNLPWTIE